MCERACEPRVRLDLGGIAARFGVASVPDVGAGFDDGLGGVAAQTAVTFGGPPIDVVEVGGPDRQLGMTGRVVCEGTMVEIFTDRIEDRLP